MSQERGARLHQEYPSGHHVEAQPIDVEYVVFSRVSNPTDLNVSIIAVQGLASSYEWTWSVEVANRGERYYWLRERLPVDLETSGIKPRILAFEYPSKWYGDPDHTTLEECGRQLLHCIVRERCHKGIARICAAKVERTMHPCVHRYSAKKLPSASDRSYSLDTVLEVL